MRTGADFAFKAAERNIRFWLMHECTFCSYPCGYIITSVGDVLYDNGCDCSPNDPRPRSWDDIASHYNMQREPRVIAEYDAFWGFAGATAPAPAADGGREG
jgi:hypothetical protein